LVTLVARHQGCSTSQACTHTEARAGVAETNGFMRYRHSIVLRAKVSI